MDKIRVVEVFTVNDGFCLLCDYFDDSLIDERLEAGNWIFTDDDFSVAMPTSCFAPAKHRAIHIRTQNDLSWVKEVLFRHKEIEEYDWFEGVYLALPDSNNPDYSPPPSEYNLGALSSYLKKHGKSFFDLSTDEIEQFRIKEDNE